MDSLPPEKAEAIETLLAAEQRSQRLIDTQAILRNKCLAVITNPFFSFDFISNPFVPVGLKLTTPLGRDPSLTH